MNRIFRSYFMAFWGLVFTGTVLVFAFVELVDPKGENDFSIGLEKSYFSSVLNVRRQLRILSGRPSAVVFGNAKVAILSPESLNVDLVNMYSLYSNPFAVLDFLGRLDERQISNITGIYYLLDYVAFNGDRDFQRVDYENGTERLAYKIRNLGLGEIQMAWQKIVKNRSGTDHTYVTNDGYVIPGSSERTYDGKLRGDPHPQDFHEDTVALLSKVSDFAKRRGIPITYFTPPFPELTVGRLSFEKHARFLYAALKATDGFYDWTYVGSASPHSEQFTDSNHAKYALTRRLFQELRTPEYYVDGGNIDRHLENIRPHFMQAGRRQSETP